MLEGDAVDVEERNLSFLCCNSIEFDVDPLVEVLNENDFDPMVLMLLLPPPLMPKLPDEEDRWKIGFNDDEEVVPVDPPTPPTEPDTNNLLLFCDVDD